MVTPENTATEVERATPGDKIVKLEESFQLFTRTTMELEDSYRKLTRRANRIDVELKRTNDELSRKVEELRSLSDNRMSILEALPNGIVVLDQARCISSVNPAAERILGRRSSELVGRHAEAVVGPAGDQLLARWQERQTKSWERDIVALDGSRRRVSFTVANLPDGSQLQVLNDLTVVTRLREQIGRLDTLAALGEMAAGVAHEIRNPLNGIDGFAGLLTRALETDVKRESLIRYASNIRRGVREVNDIVTNLLTFAAPESISPTPVNLPSLVKEVVDSFAERASRDVCLTFVNSIPATSQVAGDAVKLRIIFSNLIQNALQAVDADGQVRVSLERDDQNGSAVVTVTDNGGGIPEEIKGRLFQPFATTKAQGTGLGLAIAQKFASLHKAQISVDNLQGGAAFRVTIPLLNEKDSRHA